MKRIRKIPQRHPLTKEEVIRIVYALLPFGRVKGKIGGWRVRWQNDKPVVYRKAYVYNASQSQSSIENRNNMGASFRLAAAVNKIDTVKRIWTQSNAEGRSSYTRLIKHFRKNLKDNLPSGDTSIVPGGCHFEIEDLLSFDSEKKISVNNKINAGDTLVAVLVPFDPIKSGINEFEVINVIDSANPDPEIILKDEQIEICRNYNKYILYSIVVSDQENSLQWSNTSTITGEFCELNQSEDELFYIIIFPVVYNPKLISPAIKSILSRGHAPPGRTAA